MKVIIIASMDVFYYSYYIEGFYKIFGKNRVSFSCKEFPQFSEGVFAAIVLEGDKETKVIIDAFDSPNIKLDQLNWCDVYAKVNFNFDHINLANQNKVIPIGPSFGIKIWNLWETMFFSISNFWKCRKRIYFKRNYLSNYYRQYKRLPLKIYLDEHKVEDDYIFFISSLWAKESNCNFARSNFIQAGSELKELKFQGGFAPRTDGVTLGYDLLIYIRISIEEYFENISKSFVVFNTPAVQNCHGWKLGEYLAMGKAIISTSHYNELPEPLMHGHHLHYVTNNKVEIRESIENIWKDKEYRLNLQKNAAEYYWKHLDPETVIQSILANKNI